MHALEPGEQARPGEAPLLDDPDQSAASAAAAGGFGDFEPALTQGGCDLQAYGIERTLSGLGVGWMKEEFEAIGTEKFEERGAVTDETIAVCRELQNSQNTSPEKRQA